MKYCKNYNMCESSTMERDGFIGGLCDECYDISKLPIMLKIEELRDMLTEKGKDYDDDYKRASQFSFCFDRLNTFQDELRPFLKDNAEER